MSAGLTTSQLEDLGTISLLFLNQSTKLNLTGDTRRPVAPDIELSGEQAIGITNVGDAATTLALDFSQIDFQDDTYLGLSGGDGVDWVTAGAGDDFFSGRGAADFLSGGSGMDSIRGANGRDRLFGNAGMDELFGGEDADFLDAGAGQDSLSGDNGNDRLFGRSGDDALEGGNGRDVLNGGKGADHLLGGLKDDILTGGEGADVFAFLGRGRNGVDTITDWESGIDRVEIEELTSFDDLSVVDVERGAHVSWHKSTIVFEGIAAADLSPDDFIFLLA